MMSVIRRRLSYVVTDYLSTLMAVILFTAVRYNLVGDLSVRYGSVMNFYGSEGGVLTLLLFPLFMELIYALSGYYVCVCNKSRIKEFLSTVICVLIGSFTFFMVVLINDAFPERKYNYGLIAVLLILMFGCVYGLRVILTTCYKLRGKDRRRSIIIINSNNVHEDIGKIQSVLEAEGMESVGSITLSEWDVFTDNKVKEIMERRKIDGFLLNIPPADRSIVFHLLNHLFPYDLPIYITPDGYELVMSKANCNNVLSEPLIDVSRADFPDHVVAIKRFSDILISLAGIVVFMPVIFLLGIAVKIQSSGPMIYTQERVGYHKSPFQIYKLRSMYEDAEGAIPMLSTHDDSRVTPIGKFMRKYRLDELPNLWNVLRGDMSLVGPRPERQYFIGKILPLAPYYTLLHQVRPGLTSWGMVKFGYASSVPEMVERLKYDILYIRNLTISLDLKILFYTFRTLIKGEGI